MTAGADRLTATPPGIALGELALIADPGARGFVIQLRAGRFHGFVVRNGDTVNGYVDRCPHAGLPLAKQLDDYLTPDAAMIQCSWHGALFSREDGRCVGGPCPGASLTPWAVLVRDRVIFTA
jgi:nitrite reductase/ring-hydroxylating ferredoxin subunit